MGLFDQFANMVSGVLGGEMSETMLTETLQSAGIPDVSALVAQLRQSGLGERVASWTGAGENLPIGAEEIEQSLGGPALEAIAGHLGIDPSAASGLLSHVLPGIVSRGSSATPPDSNG